jgi:hypothetical protein
MTIGGAQDRREKAKRGKREAKNSGSVLLGDGSNTQWEAVGGDYGELVPVSCILILMDAEYWSLSCSNCTYTQGQRAPPTIFVFLPRQRSHRTPRP